ncbi:TPA: hypothetical protein SMI01_002688 [Serratia marcescens]|nr:hypothetical protein [Serratia marcescens]
MKERPVIFNGEMVRAILDGRKTQTRRVMKVQPKQHDHKNYDAPWACESPDYYNTHEADWACRYCGEGIGMDGQSVYRCPFGQVGDRLWVREAYQGPLFNFDQMETYLEDTSKFERPEFCEYRADGGKTPEYYDADDNLRYGWKPSIHMPRWASRITLEITAVRVERLNDISEEDARAEGAPTELCIIGEKHYMGFRTLWKSIYGEESWSANPWVWVIEFRRVGGA